MRLLCVLATALALVFSAAASEQVINGCIKTNGTLKIADTCSAREMPISWNVQGPPGADGTDGTDGMDGGTGPEGPPGPTLRVIDGAGDVLGIPYDDRRFFNEEIGASFSIAILLAPSLLKTLFFDAPGCTGQAYMDLFTSEEPTPLNTVFGPWPAEVQGAPSPFPAWWITRTEIVSRVFIVSLIPSSSNECVATHTSQLDAVLLDPLVGDLPITYPVVRPIYIGLPPE